MPQVKGLAFRSVLQAHATLRGQDHLDRVHTHLGSELSHTLRFVVASSWYPLASYVRLWDAILATVDQDPKYPVVVGRRCVEQDLKLVHKLAFAALSVATVLDISARLFKSYYDVGSCTLNRLEPRRVEVFFQGCLGFSAPMWTELRGAIEAFAALSSKQASVANLVSGGNTGDAACKIEVTW